MGMTKRSAARVASIALLGATLVGCTIQIGSGSNGNAKRVSTPAEYKGARSASMKYYADNSFAFQVGNRVVWSTLGKPIGTAVALGIRKEAYNLADVQTIQSSSVQKANAIVREVTVTLRNGKTVTESADSIAWLVCDESKGCLYSEPLIRNSSPRATNFSFAAMSAIKADLARPFAGQNPSREQRSNGLDFGEDTDYQFTAVALSPGEALELRTQIATKHEAWKAGAPARDAADAARRSEEKRAAEVRRHAEDEKRKAQQAKRLKELQSVRVGTMTLCTTDELTDEIKNATGLSCPGFGDSYVQQMLDAGWTMTATAIASQSQSLGLFPVVRTRYNITFQKAR